MGRNGRKNLIPFNERTEEEQREIRVKGGKASGEARRAKSDMRELMKMMLQEDVPGAEMTYAQSLTKSMLTIARSPKQGAAAVRAYETILHIIGQDAPVTESDGLKEAKKLLKGIPSVIDEETE